MSAWVKQRLRERTMPTENPQNIVCHPRYNSDVCCFDCFIIFYITSAAYFLFLHIIHRVL